MGEPGSTITISSLCLCVSVVRSEHHDFTTETQRHRVYLSAIHYPHNLAKSLILDIKNF
jgi:hypothetical protein